MTRSLSRVVSKLTRIARSDRLWPRRAIGASDLHLPARQPLQLQRGAGETVTVLRTQGRAFYRDVQVERQFGKIVGGVAIPPCGVPAVVGVHVPSSTVPALSQRRMVVVNVGSFASNGS